MPRIVCRPMGDMVHLELARYLRSRMLEKPSFSDYWLTPPPDGEPIGSYDSGSSRVTLYDVGGNIHYHLMPWEYRLDPETVTLVNDCISGLIASPPDSMDSSDEMLRFHVKRAAEGLLRKAAPELSERMVTRLANVTCRYTVGFGALEDLLNDDRVQDVFIDAPSHVNPAHIAMASDDIDMGVWHCDTNIVVSQPAMASIVTKLRTMSRSPFSLANPRLETDIRSLDSRVTLVGPPMSPLGESLSIRRHSRRPWELDTLVANGTMDATTASLLSFLVRSRCSVLVCGPRGAGKSSLLAAMMMEFPRDQRILVIEDTLELPVRRMQGFGYKVQSLFMAGAGAGEIIRTTLRMGESAMVLGEVRGSEAIALYEGMWTGKSGSSVLGTVHGDSPTSVMDRMVHDIGVPKEAFMATDVIVMMGTTMSTDGSPRRRLMGLYEVDDRVPGEFREAIRFDIRDGGWRHDLNSMRRVLGRSSYSLGIGVDELIDRITVPMQEETGMTEVLTVAGRQGGGKGVTG